MLFLAGAVCVGLSATGCGKNKTSPKKDGGAATPQERTPMEATPAEATPAEKTPPEKATPKKPTEKEEPVLPPEPEKKTSKSTEKKGEGTTKSTKKEGAAVSPYRPRQLVYGEVPAALYTARHLSSREAVLREDLRG
jgi:hypothetical protein